jgi:hypothetical protein
MPLSHEPAPNRMNRARLAAVLALLATPALGQGALPDPHRTPGAINPAVTQETIGSTICVSGWTRTIRPPSEYTTALKRQQIREFGYADRKLSDYEEDHLKTQIEAWRHVDPESGDAIRLRARLPAPCYAA